MAKEKEQRPMTKQVPALTARTQFGQILERVSRNGERFVVTKKGEAKAVILGVEDFLKPSCKPPHRLQPCKRRRKKAARKN